MKTFLISIFVVLLCNLAFCSDFVRKSNEFSLLFFDKIIDANSIKSTSNFCICPPLIESQGAALFCAGSSENLKKSFLLENQNAEFYKPFFEVLKARENGRFSLESVIFTRRFLPLKKDFAAFIKSFSLSTDSYNPALKDVAAIKISQWFDWVSFSAQKEIFKPENIAENADLMLVSIATLNFDFLQPTASTDIKFTFKNGKQVDKKAAVFSSDVAVAEFKDFEAAMLNVLYTKYSLIFLKPKELERAKTLISNIDAESFENAFKVLKMLVASGGAQLVVPNFRLNQGLVNLNSAIQNLGAGEIFEAQKYPKLSDENLKVGNAYQAPSISLFFNGVSGKTFNAQGTSLVLNRPFVVAVCESASGKIIFIGAVENPKKN